MNAKNIYLIIFAFIIFLSAFLLFQIQPIISKFILPWFGGAASVWIVCMLFFQFILFLGYLYSHLLTLIKGRLQIILYIALLILSVSLIFSYSILPKETMKPSADRSEIYQIILILLLTIGIPYFTLSTTSPLLQYWFAKTQKDKEPYLLYSFSNMGSMLGLLSYPFLIEPLLSLRIQAKVWSAIFYLFAFISIIFLWKISEMKLAEISLPLNPKKKKTSSASKKIEEIKPMNFFKKICWFLLPMNSSMMLLAFTNKLCIDIPSLPLLWVLPLSIYLLSYIITFSGWSFSYHRAVFFSVIALGCAGIFYDLRYPCTFSFPKQLLIYSLTLYFACTASHGELYRLRPKTDKLTGYYLVISGGSAIGAILVAIIAPLLLPDYFEVNISLAVILILLVALFYNDLRDRIVHLKDYIYIASSALIAIIVSSFLFYHIYFVLKYPLEIKRNFYGVIRIFEMDREDPYIRKFHLMHGFTDHGAQFTHPSRKEEPLLYYSKESGIGLAFRGYPRSSPMQVAVVGLGIGTIALYSQKGDHFRFYEINPLVVDLAKDTRYFSCLEIAKNRGAKIDIVLGDARLSMEKEVSSGIKNKYDILVLDAFSSDAIPLHLLTKEAFSIYFTLLKKDGILAIHISNRNIDLSPVILSMAEYYLYHPFFLINYQKPEKGIYFARWILLTNNASFVKNYYTGNIPVPQEKRLKNLWTDDFSNIWKLIK